MSRTDSRRFKALRELYREECATNNATCWICGQTIDYTAAPNDYANNDRYQLDHYYPVSTHPELHEDPANFRPAHAGCNLARGNSTNITTLEGTMSRDWLKPL